MPTEQKIIQTRDVRFDKKSRYNPKDLELGALREARKYIEIIEILEQVSKGLREMEGTHKDSDSDKPDIIILDLSNFDQRQEQRQRE